MHIIKPINEGGTLEQMEQEAFKAAINECRGDVLKASSNLNLGINRATPYRKME